MDVAGTVRLLDGRLVSLRPLTVADADAVLALHQHLSDHDRYFRFFTMQLSPLHDLVARLTEPADGLYALGAFDADRLIGVAHCVVVDDPTAAEVAIVVPTKTIRWAWAPPCSSTWPPSPEPTASNASSRTCSARIT